MTFRTGQCCPVNPFSPWTAAHRSRAGDCLTSSHQFPLGDDSPAVWGSLHVIPCPGTWREVWFDHNPPGQTSVPLLSFPFTSTLRLALGTGNLDSCPREKATKALQIRDFLLIDPEGTAALAARPWEHPPAPWPCREGGGDGSRLLHVSHSQDTLAGLFSSLQSSTK